MPQAPRKARSGTNEDHDGTARCSGGRRDFKRLPSGESEESDALEQHLVGDWRTSFYDALLMVTMKMQAVGACGRGKKRLHPRK